MRLPRARRSERLFQCLGGSPASTKRRWLPTSCLVLSTITEWSVLQAFPSRRVRKPSEFRHRGIGRSLVRAALSYARSRTGVVLVQLTVTHGNIDAASLYERCGFVQFGLEPLAVAVGPAFVSKVHMWCKLKCEA